MTKTCIDCGEASGKNSRCVKCKKNHSDSNKRFYAENKMKGLCHCGQMPEVGKKTCERCIKKASDAYYKKKKSGECIKCGSKTSNTTDCKKCAKIRRSAQNAKRQEQKIQVFIHYGGPICKCCGENIFKFLTLDHTNNDGATHRKDIGGDSRNIYNWIIKNNFPEGFQVLCYNCNIGKYQNGGICPHQNKSTVPGCNR